MNFVQITIHTLFFQNVTDSLPYRILHIYLIYIYILYRPFITTIKILLYISYKPLRLYYVLLTVGYLRKFQQKQVLVYVL